MKNKITITIILFFVCFAFFYVILMQFKTVKQTNITSIETMRESELRNELSNWKTKYEETSQKVEEVLFKISEYNEKVQSNQKATQILEEELQQINILSGRTDVSGERNNYNSC